MDDRKKLQWIQRNRQRPGREKLAVNLVDSIARSVLDDGCGPRLLQAIHDSVDDAFRQHCRASVERGTLVITVGEPGMTDWMRRRWTQKLRLEVCEPLRLNKIRFEYGTSGVRVDFADPPRGAALK
ncbi:MAG: hypothetical protein ACYTHJ_16565 [Planctomycetota bacterium]|jgi:hypothetical protein